MLKYELEDRIGYAITEEGYNVLNKMYNASNLNKDQFAQLVKQGAKIYKYEPIKASKIITFASGFNKTPNRCYFVGVKEAEYVDADIQTGKIKVRNVRYYDCDGYSYYPPQFLEERIIIVD